MTPGYLRNIQTHVAGPGIIEVRIKTVAYPMVGKHWREQLTGRNAAKWGRIFIDDVQSEKRARRRLALAPFGNLYAGEIGNNLDECPGAMFIWETQAPAHVQPCDARANQDFGRDLFLALRRVTGPARAWWEVQFKFDDLS